MRPSRLILCLCALLGGCATPAVRDAAAEARGYERGYRQAIKEAYWLLQNQQRPPASAAPNPATP